ncbi:glycosyltransferase family protein [Flavobacterium ardleyense]|uniref:glycosyltransferase family 2 protein n=1 Tax=Flavobacterium ardleyense TaxID=2038737 RepID=UPI00298C76AB|nr:glycosyltransferase family 2 protein [Flavobacterium ardleyense]
MRVGFNPNKDKEIVKSDYFHQIIMPVYIPNQEGYFQDSFKILTMSLESLFKTCHSKTYLSIVDNGSCSEVSSYLNTLKIEGKIHELIQTSNIGKLNAIFKALSGHQFALITITDSDVLFKNGWQSGTYQVFENFPKAGAVSPVPSSKMYKYYTENIITSNFFSDKLKFTDVVSPEGMKAFASSIGNREFYNNVHLSKYLTIESSKIKAVVGAGHFVCTYRAEVFVDRNMNFSIYSLGGDSEGRFLDKSVLQKDLWRLSTTDNYAFHMGNVFEDWMTRTFKEISLESLHFDALGLLKIKNRKFTPLTKIFAKLFANKIFRNIFLKYKGLTAEQATIY